MKIPEYIVNAGGDEKNWKSFHDDLFLIHGKSVNQQNQLKFWQVNVTIRQALTEIRSNVINSQYDPTSLFPKLTISSFSKISGISRKVLYDRVEWLEKEIDHINRLITKRTLKSEKPNQDSLITELNLRIELLRKNSGEDFLKLKKLDDRIFDLTRALEIKNQQVTFLTQEVDRLGKLLYGKEDNQRHLGS